MEQREAPRPIATFDLSAECPLRCTHCYFFADPVAGELDDDAFLARLDDRILRHGLRSALWVGGEPLLRVELLRRALRRFPRNAVVTSGAVPIPADLDAGVLVSVEGPAEVHDRLRGLGSYARVRANLAPLPPRSFGLMVTLTRGSLDAIERLPEVVAETRALGAMVGFFVGPPGSPHAVEGRLRGEAVERLVAVARAHPGTVLGSETALRMFLPENGARFRDGCIYRAQAVAFDARLEPKQPCTFGPAARCTSCGCPVVAAQLARALGDEPSDALLRQLFVRAPARA